MTLLKNSQSPDLQLQAGAYPIFVLSTYTDNQKNLEYIVITSKAITCFSAA